VRHQERLSCALGRTGEQLKGAAPIGGMIRHAILMHFAPPALPYTAHGPLRWSPAPSRIAGNACWLLCLSGSACIARCGHSRCRSPKFSLQVKLTVGHDSRTGAAGKIRTPAAARSTGDRCEDGMGLVRSGSPSLVAYSTPLQNLVCHWEQRQIRCTWGSASHPRCLDQQRPSPLHSGQVFSVIFSCPPGGNGSWIVNELAVIALREPPDCHVHSRRSIRDRYLGAISCFLADAKFARVHFHTPEARLSPHVGECNR
jgi:hypothetical protein